MKHPLVDILVTALEGIGASIMIGDEVVTGRDRDGNPTSLEIDIFMVPPQSAEHVTFHFKPTGRRVPDGTPGVRDVDCACDQYIPGDPGGECYGDGHYLCFECEEYKPDEEE